MQCFRKEILSDAHDPSERDAIVLDWPKGNVASAADAMRLCKSDIKPPPASAEESYGLTGGNLILWLGLSSAVKHKKKIARARRRAPQKVEGSRL